ncbi:MAG TPA: PAS domain S-box protein, partial [Candidatus Hydrogenedentes bacterium]|nr:PAS domain S-box protein [Candidatus Hydrogenedentota bacterium]
MRGRPSREDRSMPRSIRTLIVEDNEDDALLVVRALRQGGFEPVWQRVDTLEDMVGALEKEPWDAIISDYSMPHFSGPDALRVLQDREIDLPFLVVSGTIGEDTAVGMMKAGAHDYILKVNLKRLAPALERELVDVEVRRKRRLAEQKVLHLNRVLRAIRGVNQLITKETDRARLLDSSCKRLVETSGYLAARIDLVDASGQLAPAAQAALFACTDASARPLTTSQPPRCFVQALERCGAAVLNAGSPVCGGCPLFEAHAERTTLCTRLEYAGQVHGVIGVCLPQHIPPDDEERSLFEEVAGDIAFALHGIQIEAERERSEVMLRAIFDSASDGILLADAQTQHFVAGNNSICRMLGYSPEEIKNLAVSDIHPPESIDYVQSQFDRQARGEITLAADLPIRRKDGSVFEADVSSAPLELEGRPCLLGIFRDITERKERETELARLAAAVEHAGEAIVITNTQGVIEYVNPAFERITGFAPGEVVGQNPRIQRSGEQDEAFYERFWGTLSSGETWSGRMVNKKKNGALYQEEMTVSPVRDAQGHTTHYVAVKRDITDQLMLTRRLNQSQKMEAIGALASGIAHDFNNVLAAIIGYSELASNELPEDSPLRRDLGRVLTAAGRARDLVRQILTFSRQTEEERQSVRLQVIVKEALNLLRASLPSTIEIRETIDKDCRPVLADPTQMHQVLMNL